MIPLANMYYAKPLGEDKILRNILFINILQIILKVKKTALLAVFSSIKECRFLNPNAFTPAYHIQSA